MLVFVGAGLIALITVFAVALDVGNWFLHKRALQNQADAAALAGAAYFADCFVGDGSSAKQAMMDEAAKYDGITVRPNFNAQVRDSVDQGVNYNGTRYPSGQLENANDPTPADVCSPSYIFDVKESDSSIPLILRGFLPGVPDLRSVSAHARVQLQKEIVSADSMPLAVANVNPNTVTATFIDESTGDPPAGCSSGCVFQLARAGSSGSLSMWTGSATIPAPAASQKIGIRIGLANAGQGCAQTTGGNGYICFDNVRTQYGLVTLRGVVTTTGAATAPVLNGVWPSTICSGTPFFSDYHTSSTCGANIQAQIDFGTGATNPTLPKASGGVSANVTATADCLAGGSCPVSKAPVPLTYDNGTKIWSTPGNAWNIPGGVGPVGITLHWTDNDGRAHNGDFAPNNSWNQIIYSGSAESSDPVKIVTASESGATNPGAPYSLGSGTHTVTVTVGLDGNLQITNQPVLLRQAAGSRTAAVACDGPGDDVFVKAILNGCQTPYQRNDWQDGDPDPGLCPDPTAPPGPLDCIPLKTGNLGNTTFNALETRFSSCPPDYYDNPPPPDYDPTTDPRIVQLLVTDFSYLSSNGKIPVPVVDFGEFYITGWQGPNGPSSCANNQAWPFSQTARTGDIWGYFIKTVVDESGKGGDDPCKPPESDPSITPCVPVMTR